MQNRTHQFIFHLCIFIFFGQFKKKKSRTCTKIKFSTIDLQIKLFASNILTVFLLNYCKRISTRMLKAGACRRSKSKYPYARPPRPVRPTLVRPSTCNGPHAGHRPTSDFKCSEQYPNFQAVPLMLVQCLTHRVLHRCQLCLC